MAKSTALKRRKKPSRKSSRRTADTVETQAGTPRRTKRYTSGTRSRKRKATSPSGLIRVRMYRVGFGDFFLLSVGGGDGARVHILIDCGVHAADLHCINDAISQLAADTKNHLALIIITHRHADHISGFARGKDVFADFVVDRVWMPWFENPENDKAVRFQSNLTAVAEKLRRQLALRAGPEDAKLSNMMSNITGESALAGSSNAMALQVLHSGFRNKAPVDYYKAGDTAILPSSLTAVGVGAKILGPPIDPAIIVQMDSKNHQYLSVSDGEEGPQSAQPFPPAYRTTAAGYPQSAFSLFRKEVLEASIANAQPDMLTARARRADNTLNNQSLVVLFEIAGKRLLFAGDAQWGNWSNFLFGGKVSATEKLSLTPESKEILESIDFYKVGHHGSTNATPIDALEAMDSGFVAMCSTQPGAYGSEKNNSEVPRKPLIAALKTKTKNQLAQSTQVAVKGTPADDDPLPPIFEAPTGSGFIDYEL